ncbi:hypothetical protein BDW22DRAFT_1431700 [Trametopsis cervina]|nr:hypothetical protein BDW22DRAFT_1431700 [Trametopsis cervina]
MATKVSGNIQETLQAEFSPSLDSSLIAAIVADYVSNPAEPLSEEDAITLRKTLSDLAADAEWQAHDVGVDFDLADLQFADGAQDSYGTIATDPFSSESATTTTITTASDFSNGGRSLSSPLRFLQTAFPDLPLSRLKSALGSAEDVEDLDMESIVESIMTAEYVRESEERGDEDGADVLVEQPWKTIQPRQVSKKQKRKSGKTITFGDVRQQQHVRPPSTSNTAHPPTLDPWTQLSSIALHLESLVPSHSAAYYQSLFHSPDYSSPSEALRAALSASAPQTHTSAESSTEETQMLFGMFDILRESSNYQTLSDLDREQVMADAQLALRATHNRPDAALDLVWFLRELDGGEVAWGIYHSPVPASPTFLTRSPSKYLAKLPSSPPTISMPKAKHRQGPQSAASPSLTSSSNEWQTVPVVPRAGVNPHADFIPAYNGRNGFKPTDGKTKSDAHRGAINHRQRAGELMQRRKEALREASRAWQRGNSSTRGGEVAFYFAERARELQEKAQAERLDAVMDTVQSKRVETENEVTIDLHGATVSEAVQIARRILVETPASAMKPLKIITGRGLHSTNGVGVLGPAIKKALSEDGWNVGKWTGGLVVRGKTSGR